MTLSDVAAITVLTTLGVTWPEIWQHFKGKRPGIPTEASLRRNYFVAVESYYFWSS